MSSWSEKQPPVRRMHQLKTWPDQFSAMWDCQKRFEWRKNDRDYRVGDHLMLNEWVPSTEQYTGRSILFFVDYILHGGRFGIPDGYCVMSGVFVGFYSTDPERT